MTGSLVFRLEQLERNRRPVNPLAAFSDDELTVQLLEVCAEIAAADGPPEDRAEAIATAERIRSDIESWAAFWKRGGWRSEPEADRIRPLTGNGSGETERDKARHGEMHYRASAALASIAAMNGGQPQ